MIKTCNHLFAFVHLSHISKCAGACSPDAKITNIFKNVSYKLNRIRVRVIAHITAYNQ